MIMILRFLAGSCFEPGRLFAWQPSAVLARIVQVDALDVSQQNDTPTPNEHGLQTQVLLLLKGLEKFCGSGVSCWLARVGVFIGQMVCCWKWRQLSS